jgi:hypothetical protein
MASPSLFEQGVRLTAPVATDDAACDDRSDGLTGDIEADDPEEPGTKRRRQTGTGPAVAADPPSDDKKIAMWNAYCRITAIEASLGSSLRTEQCATRGEGSWRCPRWASVGYTTCCKFCTAEGTRHSYRCPCVAFVCKIEEI